MNDVENYLGAGWQVGSKAHPDLIAWAESGRRLFATPAWADVLLNLGAKPLFAWHMARGFGAVVPVFHRLGLRIGFLGLPIAGADFDALDVTELMRCADAIAATAQLDMVRSTQSMCTHADRAAVSGRPEVWISDLPNWRTEAHKRLRKDLAFARRAAPTLELVQDGFDSAACFDLYAATILRHGGKKSFTASYFAALKALARKSGMLGFFAARDGATVRGFAVVAIHGDVAYYLHGAVDSTGRRQGVNDALLDRLVRFGREAGASHFTLMASLWEQPGMLQFKRKWGNAIGLSQTFDHARTLSGRAAVLISRWQRRHDWQHASSLVARRKENFEE